MADRAKAKRLAKEQMKCNKPKKTPDHKTKSHVVKACKDGEEKIIRFGQQGVKGAGKNPKTAKEKAEVQLLQIHPDFADIRESDDFHEWADEQPKWVQDALYENSEDARSAARAIDLYKSDRGIGKKDAKKSNKSAASEVKAKNTRSVIDAEGNSSKILESEVQRMSADQYEKNADMIMEAIRSGNFVYDVSGSAR